MKLPDGTLLLVVSLVGSLVVTLLGWVLFDSIFLFLVLPFVPYLIWRRKSGESTPHRQCPRCSFATTDSRFQYCPRDGARLRKDSRNHETE